MVTGGLKTGSGSVVDLPALAVSACLPLGHVDENVWSVAERIAGWLDDAHGVDDAAVTMRILKLAEETGEVAAAWIGSQGANPRKGVTHTRDEVAAELGDVVMAALVAIAALGRDPRAVMADVTDKLVARLDASSPVTAVHDGAAACQDLSP